MQLQTVMGQRVARIKAAATSGVAQSALTTTEFFRLGFGLFAAQYRWNLTI
jgi:hypothetical protein